MFSRSIFKEPSYPEPYTFVDNIEYISTVKVYNIDVYSIVEGNRLVWQLELKPTK